MKKYQLDLVLAISTALTSIFCRTRRNRFDNRALLLCAIAGLLLTAAASRAVEVTWTGSINSNWSNNGNWDVHVPLSGDSVFFPNTGQTNVRADFSSYPDTDPRAFDQPELHLQSLTFDAAAPAYSIELYTSGESSPMYQARLDLDGAGVVNQSGVTQNFVINRGGGHGVAGGDAVGVDGSRMSFNNSASAGSNVTYHALGGVTTFQTNVQGVYLFLRPSGGSVVFNNSASAGSSTFVVDGGAGNGGIPAFVEFHNNSTAANGIFTNNDGAAGANAPGYNPSPICGYGGQTNFYDTASAGAATLSNIGQSRPYSGGTAGITNFRDNSSAASASIHNRGSTADVTFGGGGATQFFGHSSAASANFINEASTISYNHGGGYTYFGDDSTAANALIENRGGSATYGPGTTVFYDRSTAANAVISNRGLSGGGMGGVPASTTFHADSSAGSATIHNFHDADSGGLTQFYERTTAANAHIILEPGRNGGTIAFNDDSTAGSAFLDASANGTTGLISFKGNATAANSIINLGANSGFDLRIGFRDFASAGNATITAGEMSLVQFFNNSTAANANIAVRADSSLFFFGSYDAGPTTSAGNATIHLDGATSVLTSGAIASFMNYSTAANSSITVEGAAVADGSAARIAFSSYADAGNATILLKSSPLVGNPGGVLAFGAGASGPSARVTTEAGSLVYVAGNAGYSDTSIGYITGAGNINLGASTLIVGALSQNATLSGQISGSDGSLVKTGTDSLTLAGTNTYTGLTIVEQGTLIVNGSIASHVVVKSGATLKGTGSMGIPTVEPGGIFAPGTSPGTITVAGLNLQSGSTLQFELGATRDHIVVTNNGNITLGGLLDLSILSGFNPALGQTFSLFEGSIGSTTGAFSAVNAPIINGHALSLVYGTNSVMLELGNAGDFNGDGRIDSGDYVVWRKGLGTTYTQDDYNVWRANFGATIGGSGATAGPAGSANAAVPEPSSSTLLFAATCLLVAIGRALNRGHSSILRHATLSLALGLLLSGGAAFAGSATWSVTATGDWNVTSNWSPATVPNGAADTAYFNSSNTTAVSLSSNTEVNGILFSFMAGSTPYTITTPPASAFTISGAGITNNSGVTQNFQMTVSGGFTGLTQFTNSASAGTLTHFDNYGGQYSGAFGGATLFKNTSTADHATIHNVGGQASGASGGYTKFDNTATADNSSILNSCAGVSGASGGFTSFIASSSAAGASFVNQGGFNTGLVGGFTEFRNNSNANGGTFLNRASAYFNAGIGSTNFHNTAFAGIGIFTNVGGYYPAGLGGTTTFADSSSALFGTFFNQGAQPTSGSGAYGGTTKFFNTSTAQFATFINNAGTVSGAGGGTTNFADSSTAGTGTFTNNGAAVFGAGGGYTEFKNNSTAGSGTFVNNGGADAANTGAAGGYTVFLASSTAGNGTFTNNGGAFGAFGGLTEFNNNSTAGSGTFTNNAAADSDGRGGITIFTDTSTAAFGVFTNTGGPGSGFISGQTAFTGSSTAGNGTFTNNGGTASGAFGGITAFGDTSTAGNGTFTNNGGAVSGAAGYTLFTGSSTAGNGTFTNNGGAVSGGYGGYAEFNDTSTAGNGTFYTNGGAVSGADGGYMIFFDSATAADATLIVNGGLGGGVGGAIYFEHIATAANATLIVNGGLGGVGGAIYFEGASTGGTARVEVFGNGKLEISDVDSLLGVTIGSLEGTGNVFLGANNLTIGSNNLSTAFSGAIHDGGFGGGTGGKLTKIGTGTLTLAGTNSYTGGTTVNAGSLAVDGSILNAVAVNSGGTLQGVGSIAGNVTVAAGGVLAPGDSPGTLSVGSLALNSGSQLKIELGGSVIGVDYDSVMVAGAANLGGTLDVSLIDLGSGVFAPGAGDEFTITGAAGGVSGTFAVELLPALRGGLTWNIAYSPNEVVLSVGGVLGDYNLNGIVDAADYVVWRKGLGTTYTQDDYNVWRANFGATAGSGSGSAGNMPSQSAVPEPASAMLLLLGFVIVGVSVRGRLSSCEDDPSRLGAQLVRMGCVPTQDQFWV